jgi:isopentenyldiphosphate isomerase
MINKDEMLLVVDENDVPAKPKPRHEVHASGYWHRTSHIWIINYTKQILCQERSLLKDSNPGKWEPFFGGHMTPGADYIEGAITEIKEELGLTLTKKDLTLWKIYKDIDHKEFQGIFICKWQGDIKSLVYEKEEINQIRWVPIEEVKDKTVIKKLTTWTCINYGEELITFLE